MYNFLGRFPTISYKGQSVNNILIKIVIDRITKKYSTVYYPYVIREGERPDIIAADYYGDARYAWLVYLSNNIVDPYYEWPMTTTEFASFINKKYGGIDVASQEIAFWRNKWYGDDSIITPAYYASLPSYAKKYWTPSDEYSNTPTAYIRKPQDLVVETNKVVSLAVSNSSIFSLNQNIYQYTAGNLTGSGFVLENSDNTLVVKDVIGTIGSGTVYNTANTISTTVSSSTTVVTNISADELSYWEYVTKYDYEDELNESRKHIQIIDKRFLDVIETELDQLL